MYKRRLDPLPAFAFNKSRFITSVYMCATLILDVEKKNNEMELSSPMSALSYAAIFFAILLEFFDNF